MYTYAKRIIGAVAALLLCFSFFQSALALTPLSSSLRAGARGNSVKALQQNLTELALFNGEIDGVYGDQTIDAVRSLQQMLGLPADGACGSRTIAAFNNSFGVLPEKSATGTNLSTENIAPLAGFVVGIDAGHQKDADETYEPLTPGSNRTKARMSAGAVGIKTGAQEYEITLLVAKKLAALLENAGAKVIMVRTKHEVNISNAERAQLMNKEGVHCWVRIHSDFSRDLAQSGAYVLCPSNAAAPNIAEDSLSLSKNLLKQFCAETKAKQNAVLMLDDQAGFNWSQSPVATIEMGFLSNPEDDVKLSKNSYQSSCATGIYKGIAAYLLG